MSKPEKILNHQDTKTPSPDKLWAAWDPDDDEMEGPVLSAPTARDAARLFWENYNSFPERVRVAEVHPIPPVRVNLDEDAVEQMLQDATENLEPFWRDDGYFLVPSGEPLKALARQFTDAWRDCLRRHPESFQRGYDKVGPSKTFKRDFIPREPAR